MSLFRSRSFRQLAIHLLRVFYNLRLSDLRFGEKWEGHQLEPAEAFGNSGPCTSILHRDIDIGFRVLGLRDISYVPKPSTRNPKIAILGSTPKA